MRGKSCLKKVSTFLWDDFWKSVFMDFLLLLFLILTCARFYLRLQKKLRLQKLRFLKK